MKTIRFFLSVIVFLCFLKSISQEKNILELTLKDYSNEKFEVVLGSTTLIDKQGIPIVGKGLAITSMIDTTTFSVFHKIKDGNCKKLEFGGEPIGNSIFKEGDEIKIFKDAKTTKKTGCPLGNKSISFIVSKTQEKNILELTLKDYSNEKFEVVLGPTTLVDKQGIPIVGKGLAITSMIDTTTFSVFHKIKDGNCKKLEFGGEPIGNSIFKEGDEIKIFKDAKTTKKTGCPLGNQNISFLVSKPKNVSASEENINENNINPTIPKKYDSVVFFPKGPSYSKNKAIVVHDLYNPNRENVRLKRGKNIAHVFLNYEDRYKRVEITPSFKNFNLDDQGKFIEFLGVDKTKSDETQSSDPDDSIATPSAEKQKDEIDAISKKYLKGFRLQLEIYVKSLKRSKYYSDDVDDDLDKAFKKFGDVFKISSELIPVNFEKILKGLKVSDIDLGQIMRNLNYLNSYKTNITTPIQVKDADALILNIRVTDKKDQEKDLTPITYDILGGFKIDFSTGFVLSYLTDDKFQIVDVVNSETMGATDGVEITEEGGMKKVIEANSDKFSFGASLLAHGYTRIHPYVNPVVSFGFVLDNNNVVSFPVGVGLALGRDGRIIISGGVLFGRVKRLLPKYTLDQATEADFFNGVNDEQLTTDVFRSRPFFSLTFNFASAKN